MATMEEIMITFGSKENISETTKKIDGSVQSMASNISAAMSKMNQGFMNLSEGMNKMLGGITGGKTASDLIFGTASKAETNKVLLGMMTETEEAAESLYKTVDQVTDSSLTSMQDLIPAMNAFSAATGASDTELENITDEMANFGAAVLAQTGSTELAQSAMMDLSKGIKGAFASLDQYGVSEDALKRTGLWSGKEDDVEGYMAAVEEVIGSTKELMETNQGLDALIGKSFSRAGKKIGNEFLPIIKDVKRGFIDLDNELGGSLAASILIVSEGVDVLSGSLFTASTMINGVKDIAGAFHDVSDAIKGASKAAEDFNNGLNIASNASDMAGLAGTAGVTGGAVKGTSKAEKAIDLGIGGLTAADFVKTNNNDYNKIKKEIDATNKKRTKIIDQLNSINDKDSKKFKNLQRKLSKEDINLKESIAKAQNLDIFKGRGKSKEATPEQLKNCFGLFNTTADAFEKDFEKNNMTLTKLINKKVMGFKEGITSPFVKLNKSISNFNFGESLQNGLKKGFGGLGNIASGISGKLENFGASIKKINVTNIKSAFGKLNKSLGTSLADFSFVDKLGGLKSKLKGAEKVGETASEMKTIVNGMDEMGEVASTMGAVAPAMESGAAGAGATAAATTTLSGAFTSMIVPALALSAVIIIMIPIVSVIAAEAMVFIKLLGEFMEALHFENIDLSGAVEGLKSIATGLLYVGAAMGAMTFTSIMTGLAIVTGGFLGITGPLKIAKEAIMDAAKELQSFGSINIDPSIAQKLQSVSDSLKAVSDAMGAMTWNNITTGFSEWIADVLNFSSISDGLSKAKEEITAASSKLQEFSSLSPLPESVAQNIQNVCNSLASVGDAMGALRSIRDDQNWDNIFGGLMEGLFGKGVDIQQALTNVKEDIEKAASALSGWGLSNIDESGTLAENIKKVADVLNSLSEAFETLRGFRDNNNFDQWMSGLFGGQNIEEALNAIIKDVNTATEKLGTLSIKDNPISEDLVTGIKNVVNALTEVSNVASGLTSLPKMENFDSSTITTVMNNVQSAADGLSGLTVGEVNENTITNIKNVASAIGEVSGVMNGLTTLPPMGNFDSGQITTAVTAVQTAATELGKLSNTTFGEGGDPSTMFGTINTAITSLRDTLTNLAGGFTAPSTAIGSQIVVGVQSGLAPLGSTVTGSVSTAISSASGAASSGGQSLGTQTTDGFKSTLKLADVMSAEMGYVKSAVDNGISAAKSAAQNGAAEVVQAFKNGINSGSPGDIAHAMDDEMGYTNQYVVDAYGPLTTSAYNLGRKIVESFGNPSLNLSELLTPNWTMNQLSAVDTVNSPAPESQMNNTTTTIIFNEGAMPIDARNMTSYEAKQWLLLALESLGVDLPIKGM